MSSREPAKAPREEDAEGWLGGSLLTRELAVLRTDEEFWMVDDSVSM